MTQIVAGGNNESLDEGVTDIRKQTESFTCLSFHQ
jgi:hypothetical protein